MVIKATPRGNLTLVVASLLVLSGLAAPSVAAASPATTLRITLDEAQAALESAGFQTGLERFLQFAKGTEERLPWDLLSPDRPHHTRTIPAGATESYVDEPVIIAEDWIVAGTLILERAEVEFDGPRLLRVVDGGRIEIRAGTNLSTDPPIPEAPGVVGQVGGTLLVAGTPSAPVRFHDVSISTGRGATSGSVDVDGARFDLGPVGVLVTHDKVRVHRSSFARLGAGVLVYGNDGDHLSAESYIDNSTFIANGAGVYFAMDDGPSGGVTHSVFTANGIGVSCGSFNDVIGTRVAHSNFLHNYQEAYEGRIGASVPALGGEIGFPASHCSLENNYRHPGNEFYIGGEDTESGTSTTQPNLNPAAPPLPYVPDVVVGAESRSGSLQLSGPLVVPGGASLDLHDATVQTNHFPIGSTVDGSLHVENVRADLGSFVFRSGDDTTDGLVVEGSPVFDQVVVIHRNNGVHRGIDILDASPARGIVARGGNWKDGDTWTPTIEDCSVRNAATGVAFHAATVTINGCFIRGVSSGAGGIFGGMTIDDVEISDFSREGAAVGFLSTVSATDLHLHGSRGIGFTSALNSDISISGGYAASANRGMEFGLENSVDVSGFTFAYNKVGVYAAIANVAIATSNMENNFLFGAHAGLLGVITCSCWAPADEVASGEGATMAPLLTRVDTALPPWWGNVTLAQGSQTRTVEGTMVAPAMSRDGGTLVVTGVVDGQDQFRFGTKIGRNHNGPLGKLQVSNATIVGVPSIHVDSEEAMIRDATILNSPVVSVDHHPTVECVHFAAPSNVLEMYGASETPLSLRRIHLRAGQKILMSNTAADNLSIDLRRNLIYPEAVNRAFPYLFTIRNDPAEWVLRQNNWGPDVTLKDNQDAPQAPEMALEENFWGHPSGPRLKEHYLDANGDEQTRMRSSGTLGTWIEYWNTNQPVTEPNRTQAMPITPCTRFDLAPGTYTDADEVPFQDSSYVLTPDGVAARRWLWGDGDPEETVTTTTPTHKFRGPGNHTVRLSLDAQLMTWSQTGGTWSKAPSGVVTGFTTRSITITNAPPVADFGYTPTVVADDTAVQFADQSHDPSRLGSIAAWSWDFGDGSAPSDEPDPLHWFPHHGTFQVCLSVTDNGGLANESCQDVDVDNAPPLAAFAVVTAAPDDAAPVQFLDESTDRSPSGTIVQRAWQFGDGATGTGASPSHLYPDDGAYNVCLTVTDNGGASDGACEPLTVANAAPDARWVRASGNVLDGVPVRLDDQSVDRSVAGSIVARSWDFGDGTTHSGGDVDHAFPREGAYDVCLTVTDDDGASEAECQAVPVANAPPLVDFAVSDPNPNPGEQVAFTSTASDPSPEGSITSYQWDFGDGSVAATPNVVYSYAENGVYTVRLTVIDDDGAATSRSRTSGVGNRAPYWDPFVLAPPVLEGRMLDLTVHAVDPEGANVTYASPDLPSGAEMDPLTGRITWRPSDGQAGVYEPTIVASDGQLATDRILRIEVLDNQAPSLSLTMPTLTDARRTDTYRAATTDPEGTPVTVTWEFEMPSVVLLRSGAVVFHSFPTMGTYRVTVTARDADGIEASQQRSVAVDDAIFAALVRTHPPGAVLPTQPVSYRITVTNDLNAAVPGANVTVTIRNQDYGNLQSTKTGITDAQGVFEFTHAGELGVAHVPGHHLVTVLATAPSRTGAPNMAQEAAGAVASYDVAGDPIDFCQDDELQGCAETATDLLENICDGPPGDCLDRLPEPCGGGLDDCLGLVEDRCEQMGGSPGLGGCIQRVTDLVDPSKVIGCVVGLLGSAPTGPKQRATCDLT